jgi:hypothetical protein
MLSKLKEKTSTGYDNISATILKKLATALSPNITILFNASIEKNYFPKMWKSANVAAIWKGKGSKMDPSNYRPISVLPVLARMFEKAVSKQLSLYCDDRNVIPDQQYGFRSKSGCEHALISAVDSWMGSVDKGHFVGALLIDLSKAFDSVPHQLLLSELMAIGLSLDTLEWFHSYLSERRQRVVQGSDVSEWKMISRGFPQGSGLSPKLFNSFVRNLPDISQSQTIQFADDITHSDADFDSSILVDKLKKSFLETKQFCEAHDLTINAAKTQFIIFKSRSKKLPSDIQIDLDGCIIKPVNTVKLLGVTLDNHLTFGVHINNVVKKCHGLLGVLSRAASCMPRELLRLAYISLIRSHLEYSSAIFSTAAPTQLKKLDTIQKIASRVICGVRRDTHSAPLLEELHLDSLESRRIEHINNLVNSMVDGDCHPSFKNLFTEDADGSIVNSIESRIGIGKRRFGVYGKELYNLKRKKSLDRP